MCHNLSKERSIYHNHTVDNMKRSRKILIEKYINLRCKKLQEQGWKDVLKRGASTVGNQLASDIKAVGESPLSNLAYLNPYAGVAKGMYDVYDVAQEIHSGEKSPGEAMAQKVGGVADAAQSGLDVVGAAGAFFPPLQAADLINMGISGTRGGIELARGNTDAATKHGINTGASLLGAVPLAGDLVNVGKLGVKWGPDAWKAGKGIYNTAKKAGETITTGLNTLKNNPGFKSFKMAGKVQKGDQRGHLTGTKGELGQMISQNITQPITTTVKDVGSNIQKAGQEFGSGPLSNIYKYFKGDGSR